MSLRSHIAPQTLPFVEAAIQDGFRAFVLKPAPLLCSPVGFVYVCLDIDGSFATINASCNALEPVTLTAPIEPQRDYGTAVLVDYDETIPGAVQALREVCSVDGVVVRFMKNNAAPVVSNYGSRTMDRFHGGRTSFIEVTAESLAPASGSESAAAPHREKELSHV